MSQGPIAADANAQRNILGVGKDAFPCISRNWRLWNHQQKQQAVCTVQFRHRHQATTMKQGRYDDNKLCSLHVSSSQTRSHSLRARFNGPGPPVPYSRTVTLTILPSTLCLWGKVLHPTDTKYGDVLFSQSLGLVLKKLDLTQQKQTFTSNIQRYYNKTNKHPFNGLFSTTIRVSRQQEGRLNQSGSYWSKRWFRKVKQNIRRFV